MSGVITLRSVYAFVTRPRIS